MKTFGVFYYICSMTDKIVQNIKCWAEKYNDEQYFSEDPIIFPKKIAGMAQNGTDIRDVEIAAIFASHFAWGRRSMIVRDCNRLFDHMNWRPLEYVMEKQWKSTSESIHRTIKWTDIAKICSNLREFYNTNGSIEEMTQNEIRVHIFGQKEDPRAADKKINMMRRWLVRDDKKVDLGIWKQIPKTDLLIPLDVHVHRMATELGLTKRKQKDIATVREITDFFLDIFPDDPCKGDFALFGYGVTRKENENA